MEPGCLRLTFVPAYGTSSAAGDIDAAPGSLGLRGRLGEEATVTSSKDCALCSGGDLNDQWSMMISIFTEAFVGGTTIIITSIDAYQVAG